MVAVAGKLASNVSDPSLRYVIANSGISVAETTSSKVPVRSLRTGAFGSGVISVTEPHELPHRYRWLAVSPSSRGSAARLSAERRSALLACEVPPEPRPPHPPQAIAFLVRVAHCDTCGLRPQVSQTRSVSQACPSRGRTGVRLRQSEALTSHSLTPSSFTRTSRAVRLVSIGQPVRPDGARANKSEDSGHPRACWLSCEG